MKQMIELESLQNIANVLDLTIYEKFTQDNRQTIKKYFAQKGIETVSPVLDYNQLNHFLLGWIKANKYGNNNTIQKRFKILFTLIFEMARNSNTDKLLPLLNRLGELSKSIEEKHPQATEALTYYEDNVLSILLTGMEVKELN